MKFLTVCAFLLSTSAFAQTQCADGAGTFPWSGYSAVAEAARCQHGQKQCGTNYDCAMNENCEAGCCEVRSHCFADWECGPGRRCVGGACY